MLIALYFSQQVSIYPFLQLVSYIEAKSISTAMYLWKYNWASGNAALVD